MRYRMIRYGLIAMMLTIIGLGCVLVYSSIIPRQTLDCSLKEIIHQTCTNETYTIVGFVSIKNTSGYTQSRIATMVNACYDKFCANCQSIQQLEMYTTVGKIEMKVYFHVFGLFNL